MHRLIRRATVAPAVLVALLAVGCGGKGDSEGERIISFWQFWPEATVRPLVERYEQEHPGVRIDLQQLTWGSGLEKITAAVAAGRPPDLCELGSTWFAKFAANGALADLTEPSAALRERYLMWDACAFEGRVYALPWLTGTRALFVNRTLLAEAGVPAGEIPDTWRELLAAAKAVHDPAAGRYGFGMNAGERYIQFKKFMPFAWGNGGSVLSADQASCALNSPEVLTALRFALDLREFSLLEKQEILDQAFKDGRLGAVISGAWLLKTVPRDAPDLDFAVGLVPRPDGKGGSHASFGGGELLVTFNRSAHRDEAIAFARWLMEPEQAMEIARAEQSVLPAALGAAEDPFFAENPHQRVFLEQLRTAVFPPGVEAWVEIEDVVDRRIEEALHGAAPPEAALARACEEIDAILARRR